MNRPLRLALVGGTALLPAFLLGCGGGHTPDPYAMNTDPSYAGAAGAYEHDPSGAPASGQGGRVVLVDQSLQMPIGTQDVPEGWTLVQNLATDPQTGEMARHTLDVRGPNGELIRSLGAANYGTFGGAPFEQAWQQAAARGLGGEVQDLTFGPLRRSATVEASPGYRRIAPKAAQYGLGLEGLEAALHGQRGGRTVEGVVYLTHFWSSQAPGAGTFQMVAVVGPPERLAATLRIEQQIAASFQPNPAHQARVEQIGQMARQQSAALHQQRMAQMDQFSRQMTPAHNQRMADNQARFDAHQQMMQGRWAAADQQMQSWQAGQAASDEMHRQTINGIRGTADVYDAQTGTTYYGVDNGAGAYWVDPTNNTVVGTDAYSDNPDPYRYNPATNLDDLNAGGD
jgi:hypothetical protein